MPPHRPSASLTFWRSKRSCPGLLRRSSQSRRARPCTATRCMGRAFALPARHVAPCANEANHAAQPVKRLHRRQQRFELVGYIRNGAFQKFLGLVPAFIFGLQHHRQLLHRRKQAEQFALAALRQMAGIVAVDVVVNGLLRLPVPFISTVQQRKDSHAQNGRQANAHGQRQPPKPRLKAGKMRQQSIECIVVDAQRIQKRRPRSRCIGGGNGVGNHCCCSCVIFP